MIRNVFSDDLSVQNTRIEVHCGHVIQYPERLVLICDLSIQEHGM